jgi:hypothetical protein
MSFETNVPKHITEDGDQILSPFGPTIFQTEVDSNFTKELIEEGRKLTKEDDYNPKLAGNLKYGRSYHYKDDYLLKTEPYLKTYVERYFNGLISQYGNLYEKFIKDLLKVQHDRRQHRFGTLRLDSLWINFQQKHDYNPPHNHSGVLSFVIFCKVPKEIFQVQADSNNQNAGNIVFTYGNKITPLMGCEFPVKPYENLMFIFPNELMHYVPAYWVDEERISVSGNFVVV